MANIPLDKIGNFAARFPKTETILPPYTGLVSTNIKQGCYEWYGGDIVWITKEALISPVCVRELNTSKPFGGDILRFGPFVVRLIAYDKNIDCYAARRERELENA